MGFFSLIWIWNGPRTEFMTSHVFVAARLTAAVASCLVLRHIGARPQGVARRVLGTDLDTISLKSATKLLYTL